MCLVKARFWCLTNVVSTKWYLTWNISCLPYMQDGRGSKVSQWSWHKHSTSQIWLLKCHVPILHRKTLRNLRHSSVSMTAVVPFANIHHNSDRECYKFITSWMRQVLPDHVTLKNFIASPGPCIFCGFCACSDHIGVSKGPPSGAVRGKPVANVSLV